jgi:hypothetical protein
MEMKLYAVYILEPDRTEWSVSGTSHFIPRKEQPVPNGEENKWATGPVLSRWQRKKIQPLM